MELDLKAELTPLRLNPGDTLWVKIDTNYHDDSLDSLEEFEQAETILKKAILEALPDGVKAVVVDGLTPIAVTSAMNNQAELDEQDLAP